MTQSAMCIPLWPARNGNTAHLVMCPFAGGSSSAFRHWQAEQLADCALSLVTWPGRDRLRHLEPLRSITQLAALLANELEASVSPDTPLLLAGHSMGAQVAFETCRLLEQRGLAPQGLIISGCHAPHLHSERQLSHRDDADFIAEDQMKIYLTFDEGYENGYTDDILDVLKEKQTPAVFFVTQPYAEAEPELVQRMIDEGHIVGNHSVNHLSMPTISMEDCRAEVMGLHEYIKENFGYEMSLFRFPMGEFSEADLSLLQQLGYRSVFWSFAYRDWLVDEQPDPQQAIETIESKCHPGAIYLLHAVSQTNAQVLGQVIDDLRAQGYTFCAYGE